VTRRIAEIEAQVGSALIAVASPTEAAESSLETEPLTADTRAGNAPVRSERVFKKWWFWVGVGAVVAGGVAASVMAAKRNDSTEPTVYDASTRVIGL
jgi:hypothetical protein